MKRPRVHPAAHVRHPCGQPHPHSSGNRIHRRPTTAPVPVPERAPWCRPPPVCPRPARPPWVRSVPRSLPGRLDIDPNKGTITAPGHHDRREPPGNKVHWTGLPPSCTAKIRTSVRQRGSRELTTSKSAGSASQGMLPLRSWPSELNLLASTDGSGRVTADGRLDSDGKSVLRL